MKGRKKTLNREKNTIKNEKENSPLKKKKKRKKIHTKSINKHEHLLMKTL